MHEIILAQTEQCVIDDRIHDTQQDCSFVLKIFVHSYFLQNFLTCSLLNFGVNKTFDYLCVWQMFLLVTGNT
jgi:hypothetical protein